MRVIQELHQFGNELRSPQPSPYHTWDGQQWIQDPLLMAALEQKESERLCTNVDTAADRARTALAGDPQSHGIRPGRRRRSGLSKRGLPEKEVPVSVAAWVVKGRTAKQAADQILSKADQLTDHLLTLRTLRLKAKAQIRAQAAKGKWTWRGVPLMRHCSPFANCSVVSPANQYLPS